MAYCRWSISRAQSDFYVYADVAGGYTTHIAGRRRKIIGDPCPTTDFTSFDTLQDTTLARRRWLSEGEGVHWEWEDLPTEVACASYNDETARQCADRLRDLSKRYGLRLQDDVLDALEAEND